MTAPNTQPVSLSPDDIAALRRGIRVSMMQGATTQQIDAKLKEKYGVSSAEIMKPTGRDADRAMVNGLTLGHAPQLTGALAALAGGDYAKTRDQTRMNLDEARNANPWTMGVTQAIGGVGPAAAASMIPGMQPVAGATLANAGRGALMGAGLGAVQGQGDSRAETLGGQLKDAALGAGVGTVLGGAGGAVASKLAGSALPGGNAGAVSTAAATVLPLDPQAAVGAMTRQQTLVPGSVVLADASPEMQSFLRVIGANPKVAVPARAGAAQRYADITKALRSVGKSYDDFNGVKAPTDPEIVTTLMGAQKDGVISKSANILGRGPQREIDLGNLIDLRKTLNKRAAAGGQAGYDAKQVANQITDWLAKQNATIKQIDADYAFLMDRANMAKQTLKTITQSMAAHGRGEAANVEPASVGASIPTTLRSTAGTAMQVVKKAIGTDKSARAKAVADLLLTPQQDASAFNRLVQLQDLIVNPPKSTALGALSTGLSGVAAPQLAGQLVGATQP